VVRQGEMESKKRLQTTVKKKKEDGGLWETATPAKSASSHKNNHQAALAFEHYERRTPRLIQKRKRIRRWRGGN